MPDFLMSPALAWIAIGLAGQACFFLRFAVQWIASGRAGAWSHASSGTSLSRAAW